MIPARKPFPRGRALFAVLALALGFRLAVFFTALPDPERFFTPDARGYIALARDLHSGYLEPNSALWAAGLMRTPGYPVFGSVLLNAFGGSVVAIVLGQIFLALLAVFLTHRIAEGMFGPRAALVAALILALDPATAVYSNLLQPEPLFTVFVLSGFIALQKALRGGGSMAAALAAGSLLGLATLTRPIGILLPIPLVLVAALAPGARRHRIARSAAALLSFALIAGGWMARNAHYTGIPLLSTIEGVNLLDYRAAGAIAVEENRPIEEVRLTLAEELARRGPASANPALHSRAQSRLAMDVLKQHPYGALRSSLDGVLRLTLGTGVTALSGLRGDPEPERIEGRSEHFLQAGFGALLGLFYLGAAMGALRLIRAGERVPFAELMVFVLYFVLISAGPEANTRFRVPLMPFVAILGGAGLRSVRESRCGGSSDRNPPLTGPAGQQA